MPTKDRREREKQQKKLNKKWEKIVSNAPAHVHQRLGQPSTLSEQLYTKGQHNAPWAEYDEDGNPLPREDPDGLGANLERHENMEARALDIRDRYRDVWGKRGFAQRIAHEEGFSVETIRRYMKDYPI